MSEEKRDFIFNDISDSLQRLRNAEIHGTSILLNPNEIEEICDYIRRIENEIDELTEEINKLWADWLDNEMED